MISTKILLSAFDDKRYLFDDGHQILSRGHKIILGLTAIGIDDSDDNAAAVISDLTDDDGLENWMPFFEDDQQPVSWDFDNFLDGVSEEFANTLNVVSDHPDNDDGYSEDCFGVENKQQHHSFRQLMD